MTDGKSEARWPGTHERLIVEEMNRDGYSEHWENCTKFVEHIVSIKAKNIPVSVQEEIVQEIMYKVAKYLSFFEFRCSLKTWLNLLTENYIIDVYRKQQNRGLPVSLSDLVNEHDTEGELAITNEVRSAESVFLMNDDVCKALALLLEYANTHSKPARNRFIIQKAILEARPYAEIAVVVGCSSAVVGYVVREAQSYVRENMRQEF